MSKSAFQKPTVEEIAAYMGKKKPEWPETFCNYYAEKFWNSYEKSGWKLSAGRGGPMKSWTAAFGSNWQDLEYETDRKKLNTMKAADDARKAKAIQRESLPAAMASDIGAGAIDLLMAEYLQHPTRVHIDRLAACYEWIKKTIRVRLNKEQVDVVKEMALTDQVKAKATVVGWIFEMMASDSQTFSQLLANGV